MLLSKQWQKDQTQVFQLSICFSIYIQYMYYYHIISLKHADMQTWNNKCSNKAECGNGILLKVTNQSDQST
jgi:hypothetical protein